MPPELKAALALHKAGAVEEAERRYLSVLGSDPANAIALHFLGLARLRGPQRSQALEMIRHSILLAPGEADFHLNLGLALLEARLFRESAEAFAAALALRPTMAQAHFNLGKALLGLGQSSDALVSLRQALSFGAEPNLTLSLMLLAAEQAGEMKELEAVLATVVVNDPRNRKARWRLATLQIQKGDPTAALAEYDELLADGWRHVTPLIARANTLRSLGKLHEALSTIEQALAISQDSADAWYIRGDILCNLRRYRDAAGCFEHSVELAPTLSDARARARAAYLLEGDQSSAWSCSSSDQTDFDPKQPLLLTCDGEVNDVVHFAALIREAEKITPKLRLEVGPEWLSIFRRSFDGVECASTAARSKDVIDASRIPLSDLPSLLRLFTPSLIQPRKPYLRADPTAVSAARMALRREGRLLCGICWDDSKRGGKASVPPAEFCRAIALEGFDFVFLGSALSDTDTQALQSMLSGHLHPHWRDVNNSTPERLTAIIGCCDLIVAADGLLAQLAAASGTPVLVLAEHDPGWRWNAEDCRSVWYHYGVVIRQRSPGDWVPVLAQLRAALLQVGELRLPLTIDSLQTIVAATANTNPEFLPYVTDDLKPFRKLLRAGHLDAADKWLEDQLVDQPDNLDLLRYRAFSKLWRGDLLIGLQMLNDAREVDNAKLLQQGKTATPPWSGRKSEAPLLVLLEPNLGEEILLTSTLQMMTELRQNALIEIDGRLLSTLRRSFSSLNFIARGSSLLGKQCSRLGVGEIATSLDLMNQFISRFPRTGLPGWLRPDPVATALCRSDHKTRFPNKKIIGISWRSARMVDDEDQKSVPITFLSPLLKDPSIALIDLQYGDTGKDISILNQLGYAPPWRDPNIFPMSDIDGLATQLCALDGFISVSNSTAHLAGALGVPTVVMLRKHPPLMWHWGLFGDRSQWYSSVQFIRDIDVESPMITDVCLEKLQAFIRNT